LEVDALKNRLRIHRMRNKLTQSQMADMLGIAASTYNMIENGKRRVDLQRAKQLEEILGVSADELLLEIRTVASER
jgi:transcriptional regulator with XRE-family HTH domain